MGPDAVFAPFPDVSAKVAPHDLFDMERKEEVVLVSPDPAPGTWFRAYTYTFPCSSFSGPMNMGAPTRSTSV